MSSAGVSSADEVRHRLASIRARIDAAALGAGRDPATVRLVAVTKKLGPDAVRDAYAAGQRDFGENYVQEAVAKIAGLAGEMPDARWHLIGRLQSNKAAVAVSHFSLLHGIDSLRTVAAVSRAAIQHGRIADLMLQVNLDVQDAGNGDANGGVDGDATAQASRGGVAADAAASFLEQACVHEGIRFVGLMGVADPDRDARPQFARLRELAAALAALGLARAPLGELSMGMTGDFEDAVAEGATIVRIGTAIFGERPRG